MIPDFGADGFLPRGRYSVTVDDAEWLLVGQERFDQSVTRRQLWDGLERYLGAFLELQDRYADRLNGTDLIHSLWLGGSFVSVKVDPENIDVSVLVDEDACAVVRGNPGAGWLSKAFNRKHTENRFGISALRIGYRPVAGVFQPETLAAPDVEYFRDRGIWDDWWQRCRDEAAPDAPPSIKSAAPARGYLEVTL